jgi:DNA primase
MSETKKVEILVEILGSPSHSGSELLFKCPFCDHHKKKLSVNIAKNAAKCWICNWSTPNLTRIVKRLGDYSQISLWNELCGIIEIGEYDKIFQFENEVLEDKEEVIQLPEEFQSLCNRDKSLTSLKARRYLKERGITNEDILRWKIGYAVSGEYEGRVIVPSFNNDGKVNFFVGRRYHDSDWSKYKNPDVSKDIIFNELYVDWDVDVVIVEGVFDAIKAGNAIPLLGSTLKENSKLFKDLIRRDPAIYIALDPDAERKAEKLIKDLLNYDAEVYKIPVPDGKDIGDMSHSEFLERKSEAKLIKDTDYFLINKIMGI